MATDEILVTLDKDDYPLRDRGFDLMPDAPGIAVIYETGRETTGDAVQAVGLAQQQGATVRRHPAAV